MFGNNFGNGVGIMVIVVLTIIVVLLGIKLWAMAHPTGKVAADLKTAEADTSGIVTRAEAATLRAAGPTLSKMGTVIRSDAERLLEKAEAWITDTTAEDTAIAGYQAKIAEQEVSKANKKALGRAHVDKLQAALAGS